GSGNVQACLKSVAADEPLIALDDWYLGPNRNIGTIQQATMIGSLQWAPTTNCTWDSTSGTMDDFPDDNDCDDNPRTATGSLFDATNGLKPAFGINNAPAGNYLIVVSGA